MKGAQIGGTECGNNWIGYVIDQAPGPMLSVSPSVEMAKRSSKQRIAPMIEESPVLRGKVKEARSRDSGNTVLAKEFPGGVLVMTGANSAVGLRSMPARYLFLDEVDGYTSDVEGEGDPIALAEARTRNFRRKKIFIVSTPKIAGTSQIEREYLASDQRRFFVPCPECEHFQTLKFKQLKWDKGKPRSARYICEECGESLGDEHKTRMLSRGEWRSTAEGDGRTVGFHLSSLYSPVGWQSWVEIAQRWEAVQGNTEELKGFVNTVLGETWQDRGDAPDHVRLMALRENYDRRRIPPQGLILVASADVQPNAIFVEVLAIARDRQSWVIEALALDGDTSDPERGAFARLTEVYETEWPDSFGGRRRVDAFGVDTGFRTNVAYVWVRNRPHAFALKGEDGWSRPAIGTPSLQDVDLGGQKIKQGVALWTIGTWPLKSQFYSDLRKLRVAEGADIEPAGACHHGQFIDEPYFRQITSERLVDKLFKGRLRKQWEDEGRPNHWFDCHIYNLGLADYIGLSRFTPDEWARLAKMRGTPPVNVEPGASTPQTKPSPQVPRFQRRAMRSSFMD